jgi:hypothetical protein
VINTLAIDPGYAKTGKGCACALSTSGHVTAVWYERPPRYTAHLEYGRGLSTLDFVIIEKPEQRANGGRGVTPATLIELTWAGCALGHLYAGAYGAEVIAVTPAAWKGSIPKPVHHRALWGTLTAPERAVLGGARTLAEIDAAVERGACERWKRDGASYYPAKFLTHNLLDAVALCKWFDKKGKTAT